MDDPKVQKLFEVEADLFKALAQARALGSDAAVQKIMEAIELISAVITRL